MQSGQRIPELWSLVRSASNRGSFHKMIPLLEELRGMNLNYEDLNNKDLTIFVKSVSG